MPLKKHSNDSKPTIATRSRVRSDELQKNASSKTSIATMYLPENIFKPRQSLSHSPPPQDYALPYEKPKTPPLPRQSPSPSRQEDPFSPPISNKETTRMRQLQEKQNVQDCHKEHETRRSLTKIMNPMKITEKPQVDLSLETTTYLQAMSTGKVNIPPFISTEIFEPGKSEAEYFIRRFERCAAANGWNYSHRLKYFVGYLSGYAITWFENLVKNNPACTWPQVKEQFVATFYFGKPKRSAFQQLLETKQEIEENITTYYYRWLDIACETTLTNEYKLVSFEIGLQETWRNIFTLLAGPKTTFQELPDIVARLCRFQPTNVFVTPVQPTKFFANQQPYHTFHRRTNYYRSSKPNHFHRRQQRNKAPFRCHRCHRVGHLSRTCRSKRSKRVEFHNIKRRKPSKGYNTPRNYQNPYKYSKEGQNTSQTCIQFLNTQRTDD